MLTLVPVSLKDANAFVAEHHLHAGYGAGNQPPGRWLDVHGAGRGKTLDRQTLSRCGPLPAANEAAV